MEFYSTAGKYPFIPKKLIKEKDQVMKTFDGTPRLPSVREAPDTIILKIRIIDIFIPVYLQIKASVHLLSSQSFLLLIIIHNYCNKF